MCNSSALRALINAAQHHTTFVKFVRPRKCAPDVMNRAGFQACSCLISCELLVLVQGCSAQATSIRGRPLKILYNGLFVPYLW